MTSLAAKTRANKQPEPTTSGLIVYQLDPTIVQQNSEVMAW